MGREYYSNWAIPKNPLTFSVGAAQPPPLKMYIKIWASSSSLLSIVCSGEELPKIKKKGEGFQLDFTATEMICSNTLVFLETDKKFSHFY